ncbi:DUF2214 family protein [Xanthomonas sacchari]|uniref:DUF2214 domain-containing protein n=1 Tax=Xanthomonas sacchari TaxID=56458 RepID=A0A2P5Z6Z5_9XANT|nr:DUF2214 family protein [Xanthomonas sacchari]MDV0438304.1 DUF2214 family protein [Xanthomonas sacchari]PPU84004.1 DUF2214 domain-containing protein [Xanthomonas sacchari]
MGNVDLLLAALHHLAMLLLIAALVAEWTLLRGPLERIQLTRLVRIDAIYGVAALLILAIGALRVRYGLKGADYYLHNPWFWAKLGTFAAIGLLSLVPTLRLLRWRRQARRQPDWAPPPAQVRTLQRLLGLELALVAALVVLAAAMARYRLF